MTKRDLHEGLDGRGIKATEHRECKINLPFDDTSMTDERAGAKPFTKRVVVY